MPIAQVKVGPQTPKDGSPATCAAMPGARLAPAR
jgi:hypothetical protein